MHAKAERFIRRDQHRKMHANRQRVAGAREAEERELEQLRLLNRQIEANRQTQQAKP